MQLVVKPLVFGCMCPKILTASEIPVKSQKGGFYQSQLWLRIL